MRVRDYEFCNYGENNHHGSVVNHWEDSDISDWFASDEDEEKKAGDDADENNGDTSLPDSSFSNDNITVNEWLWMTKMFI